MKKHISILFAILLSASPLMSQTTLSAGDIAFVSVNSSGYPDQFSFVLLESLTTGTIINFTDCGWNNGIGFTSFPGDSHFTWTADAALEKGIVITITTNNGNTLPQATAGNISGDNMLISIAGDQIFAYQGTMDNPKFISGINFNRSTTGEPGTDFDGASISNSTTGLPSQLTIGKNAVQISEAVTFSEQANSIYNGVITVGTKAELSFAINTSTDWNTNSETPNIVVPFPVSFTVSIATDIENENNDNLRIFPNPVVESFKIEGIDNSAQISLINANGNIVLTGNIVEGEYVSVQALPRGVYILKIETGGMISFNKLVIR